MKSHSCNRFKIGDEIIVVRKPKDCHSCNICQFVGLRGRVGVINYDGTKKVYVHNFKEIDGGCSGFNENDLKLIGGFKRSGKVSLVIC